MKKLHLICNAHIDPVWQWTFDEGISAALSTFKTACDLADEFDYVFCHNESALYEQIEKISPQLFERIKKLVTLGKWKIIGGWYIQPDCLLPCGESFVRQIKVGQEYFRDKFGVVPEIAANFDSFGHSIGLVQILAKCGYKGYVVTRPFKWQMEYPDGHFYRWVAPSGDSVIFSNFCGYGSLLGEAASKITEQSNDAEEVDAVLWGVGNHGGGPSRKDLRDIAALKIDEVQLKHSTLEDLFSDNIKISADIRHSLVTCMPGCYSSMAKIKKAHREAENILYSTEKLLAAASLAGFSADMKELHEAQKKLLLAEFHDILPGTCVPNGEENGLELLHSCLNTAKDYRTKAFMYLTVGEAPAKDGEYPIFVFNPMPYRVTVPVEAEYMLKNQNWTDKHLLSKLYIGNEEIPCQEIKEESNLNLDWRKKIIFDAELEPMTVTRFSVYSEETPGYFPFDKQMVTASLSDELKNTILTNEAVLELYDDTADPWGMSYDEMINGMGRNPEPFRYMDEAEIGKFIVSSDPAYPVHITEDGEVLKAIESFTTCGNTDAVIEYKKYKQHSYIDLKITVEFADKNKLVKLKIPVPNGTAIGDGPYVIEEKPDHGEVSFRNWLGVRQDDGNVYAVINNGVYSGTVNNGYIYLTLLRGAGYTMHPIPIDASGIIRGDRKLYATDRYLPRIDSGRYVFNFRIMVGSIDEVTQMAELFNQKPYALNIFPIGTGERKTDIHTDVPTVMPMMKIGDDGGYIFRFFNPTMDEKNFALTIEGCSTDVSLKKAEVASVVFKDGVFIDCSESMPV